MHLCRQILFAALLAAFAALAGAQGQPAATQKPGGTVIRMNVELVNLLCTVRDKTTGAYVNTLSQDDFQVKEDGRPVEIRNFARQSDLPLTVALLLDVSISTRLILDQETAAARQFFGDILRPDDHAMLVGFAAGVDTWQTLTSSKPSLYAALDNVPKLAKSLGPGRGTPIYAPQAKSIWIAVRGDGGSRLFDAVDAVSRAFIDLPGRKAIVAITDGKENGSLRTLNQAAQAALASDVIVYGIRYADQGVGSWDFVKELSDPTGGRTFDVAKNEPVDKVVSAIEDEIRNQYALVYNPPEDTQSGKLHKVEVKVIRPGLIVRSRTRYYR